MTFAIAQPFDTETPVPCAGEDVNGSPYYLLFDSTFMPDHRAAKIMCLGVKDDPARPPCPALAACRRELDAMLATRTTPAFEPEGTWAGRRFVNQKNNR